MDYIAELRRVFRNVKRENANYRVGPCPGSRDGSCDGHRTVSVNIYGNKVPVGIWRCWQCGLKGTWNDLAKITGMRKVKTETDLTSDSERRLAYYNETANKTYQRPPKSLRKPWHGDWRGVPEVLLRSLDAQFWADTKRFSNGTFRVTERLILPVMMHGEEVGYIGAKVRKKGNKGVKYKNSPGEWAHTALYPYDFFDSNIVCLVEGPFDALNLLKHGIPALCFLGVENWQAKKASALAAKGAEYVIPLGDNDKGGQLATKRMINDLKDSFKIIRFKYQGKDPGEMDKGSISVLKQLINRYKDV